VEVELAQGNAVDADDAADSNVVVTSQVREQLISEVYGKILWLVESEHFHKMLKLLVDDEL